MSQLANANSLWAPLLLADPSPLFRSMVLRDLLGRGGDDEELLELEAVKKADPLLIGLISRQSASGSWEGKESGGVIQGTSQALLSLGYLGFGPQHPAVASGAEFLFSMQDADGSWPLSSYDEPGERYGNYSMIPLQSSMPLRALASCGYGEDPRSEKGYEWLLNVRLEDGAWPTGIASGNYGRVAGYRRIAHSRLGCRTNTTSALLCLAMHPHRKTSPQARAALDLLLVQESRDRQGVGFEIARMIGAEPARGLFTYFAQYDAALMLDLCWRVGASLDDERVERLVAFVRELQGPYGLWEHPRKPQASRWLTFDLLRSLSQLDSASQWFALEPSTPFQSYPAKRKRF